MRAFLRVKLKVSDRAGGPITSSPQNPPPSTRNNLSSPGMTLLFIVNNTTPLSCLDLLVIWP